MINGCIEGKVLLKVLDFDKDIPVLVDKIAVAHFLPPKYVHTGLSQYFSVILCLPFMDLSNSFKQ